MPKVSVYELDKLEDTSSFEKVKHKKLNKTKDSNQFVKVKRKKKNIDFLEY